MPKKFYYVDGNPGYCSVVTINLKTDTTLEAFLEKPPIAINPDRLKVSLEEANTLLATLNTPPE